MNLIGQDAIVKWLVGNEASEKGVPQLQWTNMPESWGVFVLLVIVAAIAIAVAWMYLREISTCPTPVKWLLAILRFSVLLLLVVMFLNPSITFVQTHSLKPNIALARDASLSFARTDSYTDDAMAKRIALATGWNTEDVKAGKYTRAGILEQVLNRGNRKLIEEMRDKGSLRVIDFADVVNNVALIPAHTGSGIDRADKTEDENSASQPDEVEPDEVEPDDVEPDGEANSVGTDKQQTKSTESIPPLVASGIETDMWQLLRELLSDSNRLSSIVIAGDGQHNGSDSDLLELARQAGEKNIPIYTIGVGDSSRPRNIKVVDVYARDKAQPNEPFEIEALFYAEDIQAGEVDVELIQQELDASGKVANEKSVATESLKIDAGGSLRLNFQQTVTSPGTFVYKVVVAAVDGEIETSDNEDTSSVVEVVDEKVKVLLIAGAPTWEYRLVQPLLQRDPAISLTCWLQTMDEDSSQLGNEPISQFPRTIEELGQYNVVMLFDPDPKKDFDEEWVESIKVFCRRKAGGVLYMAGPKFTNMFMTLNRLSGFKNMLPVQFGDDNFFAAAEADLITANVQQGSGSMLYVKHNLDHPVMSFSKDLSTNETLWAKMPTILWSYPTMAAKPASQVLMERGDAISEQGNPPLLVAGRYGAGNVLYMGFNGTWRWRRIGLQAQYFDKFWIQTVRYLVETRSLQGSRRGFIDSDRQEYELGNNVTLIAQIDDERFQPLKDQTVPANILGEDGINQAIQLKATPGQEGNYEITLTAQRTGNFQVFVNLPGVDDSSGIEPVSYRVVAPSVESQSYWLNEKLLRDIADASGGKYFAVDQLEQLVEALPANETKTEYKSPPQPVWSIHPNGRWLVFLLPFLLLTVEWAVRKRCRLL